MVQEANNNTRWSARNDDEKHTNTFDELISKWMAYNIGLTELGNASLLRREREIEEKRIKKTNPLDRLNDLLESGNIPIEFKGDLRNTHQLTAHNKDNDSDINIHQMSDGERFAFLFAATAVTLPKGSVLFIDEPEIHLHQSIINPFLLALTELRKDCFFVFSTHSLALPVAYPKSDVVIVRSCEWMGDAPARFDAQIVPPGSIPEDVKEAILGAKENILFVEGKENSLDTPLYSALFPDITVKHHGSGNNKDVSKAVKGINETEHFHRVKAYGLIDRDMQLAPQAKDNIGMLWLQSVESIYYSPEAIEALRDFQETTLLPGPPSMSSVFQAIHEILSKEEIIKKVVTHRAKFIMERDFKEQLNACDLTKPPAITTPKEGISQVVLPVRNIYLGESQIFEELVTTLITRGIKNEEKKQAWRKILANYRIHKNTGVLAAIAQSFNLNRTGYEKKLISLIQKDVELAKKLRFYIEMPPGFDF